MYHVYMYMIYLLAGSAATVLRNVDNNGLAVSVTFLSSAFFFIFSLLIQFEQIYTPRIHVA